MSHKSSFAEAHADSFPYVNAISHRATHRVRGLVRMDEILQEQGPPLEHLRLGRDEPEAVQREHTKP